MDRIDALQAFARVVESGSFTKAALTLNLSKTTVSQLVQRLEARLRVRLLNRTTRRVELTADGLAYYERVVRLLSDLEEADASVLGASVVPRGRLRVDVPSPLASLILMPALPAFHARYPDIQLEMGVSDRIVDLIGEHVDCVLRGGELGDSSLTARRVGELRFGVYAAPAYLARAGTPGDPRALADAGQFLVGFRGARSGKLAPTTLRRDGKSIGLAGRHAVVVDDGNAYLAAGLAGMGVLSLPHYMAQAHVAGGALVPLFDGWRIDAMPLYLAYPPNRHPSARLRVFAGWLEALMAQHLPVADASAAPRLTP